MADRVEVGNIPPADLIYMAMETDIPQTPGPKQESMYDRQLDMTSPGREKVL